MWPKKFNVKLPWCTKKGIYFRAYFFRTSANEMLLFLLACTTFFSSLRYMPTFAPPPHTEGHLS